MQFLLRLTCVLVVVQLKGNVSREVAGGDRARRMLGRDCQLMGLTWLLAKNKTVYIPTVSAVLRAMLYSARPTESAAARRRRRGAARPGEHAARRRLAAVRARQRHQLVRRRHRPPRRRRRCRRQPAARLPRSLRCVLVN